MRPRETRPGTNGPSSFTRNHSPNSRWSVNARQTRETDALSSMRFSMLLIRNLLVACQHNRVAGTRNHFVAFKTSVRQIVELPSEPAGQAAERGELIGLELARR